VVFIRGQTLFSHFESKKMKFLDWIFAGLRPANWDETARDIEWDRVEIEDCFTQSFPIPLTAPEAVPEVLVGDGMQGVMNAIERHKQCPVAVMLPGSEALIKVFGLPKVERKKLEAIIKFEVKQQIPFDLTSVTWQSLYAGKLEIQDDLILSGNILLTAVKNQLVAQSLSQFGGLQSRVDLLTIEQLIMAELGRALLQGEETVALFDMHADRTQLCFVSRNDLWCRSVPIGGNHFTQQLARDFEMTFSEAEQLKINVMNSDDPKTVFKAIRLVFQDLAVAIERSIHFRKEIEKTTSLSTVYITGGPAELPGLGDYLGKRLGLEVQSLANVKFTRNDIDKAMSSEFVAATVVALQRLGYGHFRTNFLPKSFGFGRKEKSAWGLKVGNAGISAVKVSLRD
jgi:type IV pilus assembly protein PilM